MDFNIFDLFQCPVVIILLDAQEVPYFTSGSQGLVPHPFDTTTVIFDGFRAFCNKMPHDHLVHFPVLESAISPRSSGFFTRKLFLDSAVCSITSGSLFLGIYSDQSWEVPK